VGALLALPAATGGKIPNCEEKFPASARSTTAIRVSLLARSVLVYARMDRPPPRQKRWRTALLILAMVLAIGGIAVLGVMDERWMVTNVRHETSRDQQVLAEALAAELRIGLSGDGPPVRYIHNADGGWRTADGSNAVEPRQYIQGEAFSDSGEHRVLLWSPAALELWTLDGELVTIPSVAHAAATGEQRAWLTPSEARRLGLPEELAVAALARIKTGRLGDWTLAVVSSTQRQRGREARRYARTIVMVSLASLVVVGVGLILFRTQRQERVLEQALARETLRAQQEVQLAREGRAATMLTFAAGIAHELSTPLGVIAMRAEQLEKSAEDDRARRGARAIHEQVDRIHEQARRFLAIARGAAPLRERFPAAEVLRNAAARVRHRFERAGVSLTVEPCDHLPWIHGDARLLEHSLTNLLINACDASPTGTVVELAASVAERMLTIVVRDRGAGIDPALYTHIRPFFSTKAEGEGTGLGLAIASEVMRMHRGELTLEARLGGGTCAVLRLPAESAPTEDSADPV
jgi:two-component system, NtrC family, sensor kinase